MSQFSVLKNAPIVEVAYEVQVTLPEGDYTTRLDSLHADLKQEYPIKEEDRLIEFEFTLDRVSKSGETSSRDQGIRGFKFSSEDKKQIVQCRKDAFTFNRLAPYFSWEKCAAAIEPAWRIYREALPEATIKRVGLRYINKVNIPLVDGTLSLEDYFQMHPPDLKTPGFAYMGFMNHCVIFDPKTQLSANWILANQAPEASGRLCAIIDIDVYDATSRVVEVDPCSLWADMRWLKNRLFFDTFTEKGLELFQ